MPYFMSHNPKRETLAVNANGFDEISISRYLTYTAVETIPATNPVYLLTVAIDDAPGLGVNDFVLHPVSSWIVEYYLPSFKVTRCTPLAPSVIGFGSKEYVCVDFNHGQLWCPTDGLHYDGDEEDSFNRILKVYESRLADGVTLQHVLEHLAQRYNIKRDAGVQWSALDTKTGG